MIHEHFFNRGEPMLDALAADVQTQLRDALQQRARASLVLSGGTTPAPLYRQLGAGDLDWARIDVALTDERCVPMNDPRSNARMLRETLLQGSACMARFVDMHLDPVTLDVGEAESRYRSLGSPFDVTLLGMGADGHIASLFPYAADLAAAMDLQNEATCVRICAPRGTSGCGIRERVSLTLRALLASRIVYLLIRGDDKRTRYEEARRRPLDPLTCPARALMFQVRVPVHVYWSP